MTEIGSLKFITKANGAEHTKEIIHLGWISWKETFESRSSIEFLENDIKIYTTVASCLLCSPNLTHNSFASFFRDYS